MTDKKLCVAIPTYNNSDNIKKKIENEASVFAKYDIDIHVFDSSADDTTKIITEKIQRQTGCIIYYTQLDSDVPSNEKVFRIFEWAAKSEYKYVWMIHDHTVCNEDSVKYLLDVLDNGYDFLILNMQSGCYQMESIESLDEFLLKGAWRLNSFGASVINTKTFLEGTNWDEIRYKYGDEKAVNYSHIGYYYERASQINDPRICQVHFDRKDFIDFNRTNQIRWEYVVFRICLECWGEVITRLPDCYTCKIETLRSQDKWFMSKYSLLIYRKKKYYNISRYMKYRKWMKVIYPDDVTRNFWIAILPYKMGLKIFCKSLLASIYSARRDGRGIYIFGAGRHAVECASFLRELDEAVDGFVVSDTEGNPQILCEKKVYKAEDELKGKSSLVLMGILTSGIPAVKDLLHSITDVDTIIDIVEMV